MDFNNKQNKNFNNIPFWYLYFQNLNFNNPNINFNPNQLQYMLQMNKPFNMSLPNNNFINENLPTENLYNSNEKISENLNNSNEKASENLFPYIQGERNEITFINSKNEMKIVKIPISLRKDEIYSIAEKYKSNKYYQIKHLLHNTIILENDDSSIDCILNGDSIKIIEFLEDCDLYYYD